MKATVYPNKVCGKVTIPPSKSMAHRAIICASLAKGTSIISNISFSDDIQTTIEAMTALGATIEVSGSTLTITGVASSIHPKQTTIDAHESGSTLRFLIPIFSLSNEEITFLGRNRLLYRPQGVYEDIFKKQNLGFIQTTDYLKIKGALIPCTYEIDGSISSQFISGLLFTLPLLKEDSIIKILPPFESESYVELTIQLLELFGIHIERKDATTFYIPGNQTYVCHDYRVEGDFSQFAFFACLGALNNDLDIYGVSPDSKQGDKAILNILENCGVSITPLDFGYHIKKSTLHSSTVDLKDCPDLGPILCVLGAFIDDFTITNCRRLRMKESDRILAMEEALRPLGVDIQSDENNIYIKGNKPIHGNMEVYGAKDHRIVMSMAIMATLLDAPLTITTSEAINKSYPNFFEDLQSLHVEVKLYDNDPN